MSPSKEEPSAAPSGKIAIKGFSLSTKASASKPGAKPKPQPPPSNLGKRSRGGFGHDSDSEDDHRSQNTHEAVTGFGSEGAIRHESREEGVWRKGGELVIKKMANRDWRAEATARKRGTGKDLLPAEERAMRDGVRRETEGKESGKKEGVDVVNGNDGEIQWGLSVRKRARTEESDGPGGQAEGQDNESAPKPESMENLRELEAAQTSKPAPVTADEEALASLLGTSTSTTKRPDLVIPTPLTEQEAYKAAVASAPDPSSLEDYERIPVEEFGAALLRGMGWKGEKNADTKKREVKRRQNLLGLGAKELDGAEELGAWVQKSDVKRLNPGGGGGRGGGGGGFGGGERRPKAGEYKREKERERERREERGGGGYRREKERERERDRDRDGGSGRDRHREYRR
ncbi:hypothetical protein ONS95_002199 [Cadophora gregata]|uniref:uncharacterized protein n=1 Tax=Cadophora gregata TaxID=51156 RepID=UPI0026DAC393|nr:uncharacterized protein ONS95_002199 [Cadophora gregata]KAK0109510.1 hypothetical protein ONS95_002199 [Cadophora gregata]